MTPLEMAQVALFLIVLVLGTPVLGRYMARVFAGERTWLSPVLSPLERFIYKLAGVDLARGMGWQTYAAALLVFNGLGFGAVFGLQLAQRWLPLNPQSLPNVPWALALNTAVSFMTNTNWQSYAGETTLSYATQMLGLTVQNFVSAATGIAVFLALARGLAHRPDPVAKGAAVATVSVGNFWADLVRGTLYVLLPLSLLLAVVLVSQGVVQTLSPYVSVTTLAGQTQVLPLGPAASQIAIKQLGTNGGGFFNANSAHPFENPTPLTNFLEMVAILALPAGLVYTYGAMVGSRRQGAVIFFAMLALLGVGLAVALAAEYAPNPVFGAAGSLEGKETRFGVANSVLWMEATTVASNGSVNAMHSSLAPLSGLVALVNIMLGEVIFGGVGAGMYGILMHVVLTVFIAGLMVGRTPEYLGKKIEAFEIQMAMVAVLLPNAVILIFGAAAAVLPAGLASLANAGPHGLSEILYAFSSAAGNNGSAFAGLNANTDFYNLTLAAGMLIGRFAVILPALAMAGHLAVKKVAPPSAGTFPTDGLLFVALLVAVIVIVSALTFFPALSLGPLMEHFLMLAGRTF
jgi:potassium-transporting ATPase potassium-binding subunit